MVVRIRIRSLIVPALALLFAVSCGSGDVGASLPSPSATSSAQATPSARPTHPPRFASVAEAVAFIGSKVYLPVVLPPGLPHGLQLWHGRKAVYFEHLADGKTAAQLYLRFPHGYVILEYGNGGFDGCSASEARPARVGSHPAMLYTTAHKHRLYAEIVWPATPHDVTGRYGITGPFTAAGILRLARGMDAAVQAVKRQRKLAMPSPQVGC